MDNSIEKKDVNEVINEQKTDVQNVTETKSSMGLKRLNEDFVYELMRIPTASHHEYRMVTFVMIWAKRNGIKYDMDSYGNIYLTKGTLDENEFYPCVTAHLDTVQTKQTLYAKAGAYLDVKTKVETNGKHKIYVDGFGIGGDDKAGVLLCLSMFSHFEKLKACFFLEEEVGCCGSKHLDKEWFKNVGYVIGYDSPDLNRAAHTCSGTKLMNKKFFEDNGLAEICSKHGLNDFRSEPFTDVVEIRKATEIVCMNFGTGYYNCHTDNEYCIIEDMDSALDMGVEIINKLGLNEYKMKCFGGAYYATDEDTRYFDSLNPTKKTPTTPHYGGRYYDDDDYYGGDYGGYGGYGGYNGYNSGKTSTTTTTTTTTTQKKDTDKINYETVQYVTERYDEYILSIKERIAAKCKENDIDFDAMFKEIFSEKIAF